MILCFRKSHCVWLHVGCVLLCTDLDSYGNSWRKYPACWTPINLPGKSCLMVNIMRILWTYPVAIKVLLKSFIYTCVRYDDFKNVSYQNKWLSSVFYQYIFYSSQPVSMTPKLMMLWNRPWFPVESRCILGTFWPIGMMGMMFQRSHLPVLHLARHHWLWNVG